MSCKVCRNSAAPGAAMILLNKAIYLSIYNFCFPCIGIIISCIIYFIGKFCFNCHLLLQPSEHLGVVLPDSDATFELFDRVVNVKLNAAVPFGLRGTITGIHQGIFKVPMK